MPSSIRSSRRITGLPVNASPQKSEKHSRPSITFASARATVLVGVRVLNSDFLAVERFGDDPALIVIETKGYTETGTVNVEWGVVQADDHPHEANAAYVAAPVGPFHSRRERSHES